MTRLPGWTDHLPQWIPHDLSELHGPREGLVDLPLDLCWSGRTRYDVGRFPQRVALYAEWAQDIDLRLLEEEIDPDL